MHVNSTHYALRGEYISIVEFHAFTVAHEQQERRRNTREVLPKTGNAAPIYLSLHFFCLFLVIFVKANEWPVVFRQLKWSRSSRVSIQHIHVEEHILSRKDFVAIVASIMLLFRSDLFMFPSQAAPPVSAVVCKLMQLLYNTGYQEMRSPVFACMLDPGWRGSGY